MLDLFQLIAIIIPHYAVSEALNGAIIKDLDNLNRQVRDQNKFCLFCCYYGEHERDINNELMWKRNIISTICDWYY